MLSSILTLSDRMQDELDQISAFVKTFGRNEEEISESFIKANEINPNVVMCKRDSKPVLEKYREYCIKYVERMDTCGNVTPKALRERKELFSEVYAEEDVNLEELPEQVKKRIGKVERIHHYKDVFNAKGRDFLEDKYSGKVILANNRDKLFYPGAPFCQSFGNEHFYYTSCVKNCIYDCKYCYLRGMYPCGLITFFVNLDDYFKELEELLKEHPVYLCVSYDTDLLALESLLGYCRRWIEFAGAHKDLKIEIRTKSGNAEALKKLADISTDNVIFAWTLSPDEVAALVETNVPSLDGRLKAIKAAKEAGYPVRLCFDPMIFIDSWRYRYSCLFKHVFEVLKPEDILDISVGVFRISHNYLRRMRNISEDIITAFPYVNEDGACHYGSFSKDMQNFAKEELGKYYPEDRIYEWK